MSETTKPTKVQSLSKRVAELEAKLTVLHKELAVAQAVEAAEAEAGKNREAVEVTGLPEFTKVRFTFGRKDTRKEYTGEVVAFRPASGELAAAYRIETGTGFELQVLTVPARDVQPIVPVAVEDAPVADVVA
jgi:hypothetical protein